MLVVRLEYRGLWPMTVKSALRTPPLSDTSDVCDDLPKRRLLNSGGTLRQGIRESVAARPARRQRSPGHLLAKLAVPDSSATPPHGSATILCWCGPDEAQQHGELSRSSKASFDEFAAGVGRGGCRSISAASFRPSVGVKYIPTSSSERSAPAADRAVPRPARLLHSRRDDSPNPEPSSGELVKPIPVGSGGSAGRASPRRGVSRRLARPLRVYSQHFVIL